MGLSNETARSFTAVIKSEKRAQQAAHLTTMRSSPQSWGRRVVPRVNAPGATRRGRALTRLLLRKAALQERQGGNAKTPEQREGARLRNDRS